MFEKIKIKRDKAIKRLRIEVGEGGVLLVSAPIFVSDAVCMDFIRQNSKKLNLLIGKQLAFDAAKKELDGHFLYLGKKTPIKIDETMRKRYIIGDDGVALSKKEHFQLFLKEEAKRIIAPKVEDIASFYGVSFEKVAFKDAKTRWGSCSVRKNLNFSTRLVGAPRSVIEYVVIHEICHLKEMNHSKRFWSHVAMLARDYKESEKWLKDNGKLLFLY